MENDIFYCLVEERKQERQKIGGKFFPLGPPFFILPIWEENKEGKVLKNALYTSTLNLSCISFSLLSSLDSNVAPLFAFFFFFLVVAPFFFLFLFLGNHVVSCHFFFSWALTLPIFSSFFLFFYFLGLGCDSLFLFLLTVIFF